MVPGLIVMPEVPVERLLQVASILEGCEVDALVLDAAPEPFHEDVVMIAQPLPSMLIRMPCSLRAPVKASLVNWAP